MIGKIIEWSVRNKFLIILATVLLVVYSVAIMQKTPLDAIPDLSDTQVIVYSKWDKSPTIIEDQVTYPIVTALLGAPKIKTVRGITDFGFSYVYVIFEDGTDRYWARSRVQEYLSKILPKLPAGVQTELGPDATSIGWVYQYALVDDSGKHSLAELRSLQDWNMRFHLQSVPGVAEVASVGGFGKTYQVNIDPIKLKSYGINLSQVVEAVKKSNADSSGGLIEVSGTEFMVRSKGLVQNLTDLENISLAFDSKTSTSILIKHVANVTLGGETRRGVTDFNGLGDTAGGIVIIRQGENALNVIDAVKNKIESLKPSLPSGVRLISTYDRSDLIKRAIDHVSHDLVVEMIIVSMVILFFLWHVPSAVVPIITIPVSVILAFIPLYFFGITTNIMSLAGIAISIGVLVDGAIVEVENAYKRLEEWNSSGQKGDFHKVRLEALKEVGPSVFFSLLVVAVSFFPVFTLVDQEGRLFKPLAISKTLAMLMAALLAVTFDPAVRMLFSRMKPFSFRSKKLSNLANKMLVGTYYPEEKHPVSKRLFAAYEPVVNFVLRYPKQVIFTAVLLVLSTIPVFLKLGSEFMPPLNEGSLLYMPTSFPGMSITEAKRILQVQDNIIKSFAEVETVYGKAGRADTATDPAPLSMVETTIVLKPEDQWPKVERWYASLPSFVQRLFYSVTSPHRTIEELKSDLNSKLKITGMPNIWTMPIKNRVDMLSTGIRTSVGVKVLGADLLEIQKISEQIEAVAKQDKGTRTAFAERSAEGYYADIHLRREDLARYGVLISDAQMVIASALGGETISTAIQGRERYPISVRYARAFRESAEDIGKVLVATASGGQIPLQKIADIALVKGPSMIRDEGGLLAGFVYIDTQHSDLGGYISRLKKSIEEKVSVKPGYSLVWSGQYENMQRVKERLTWILPLTLILISLLLYLNTKSVVKTSIILLAVPFSLIGSVWLLYLLGYNLSIAVWVGMIALMGLDAETGVFMLMYLDMAYEKKVREHGAVNETDLKAAIIEGAVKRIRPKLMTVMAAFMGLLPIMWSVGAGSDVMKRIAAPMVGGLVTSFALELVVYPAVFYLWKSTAKSS